MKHGFSLGDTSSGKLGLDHGLPWAHRVVPGPGVAVGRADHLGSDAPEPFDHLIPIRAAVAVLLQHLLDHRDQRVADAVGDQACHVGGHAQVHAHDHGRTLVMKQRAAAQGVEQARAEGIDVDAVIEVLDSLDLLRAHVMGRAEHDASLGQSGGSGFAIDGPGLGEAEVAEFAAEGLVAANAGRAQEDVRGLDVAMNDAVAPGVRQRPRHLHDQLDRLGLGQGTAGGDVRLQIFALHQFHDQVELPIVGARAEHAGDVGVVEPRARLRFDQETLVQCRERAATRRQQLDRGFRTGAIPGAVDDTHATFADLPIQDVALELEGAHRVFSFQFLKPSYPFVIDEAELHHQEPHAALDAAIGENALLLQSVFNVPVGEVALLQAQADHLAVLSRQAAQRRLDLGRDRGFHRHAGGVDRHMHGLAAAVEQPADRAREFEVRIPAIGFHEIGGGTEADGGIELHLVARAGEDDDRNGAAVWLGLDHAQQLRAPDNRQAEIEDDQRRGGLQVVVQSRQRLDRAVGDAQRHLVDVLLDEARHQADVVEVVLDQQNVRGRLHLRFRQGVGDDHPIEIQVTDGF